MRVLILSVTAGFGHHATAKAIGDMLESKGAEVHTLDVYAYISSTESQTTERFMWVRFTLRPMLAKNTGDRNI